MENFIVRAVPCGNPALATAESVADYGAAIECARAEIACHGAGNVCIDRMSGEDLIEVILGEQVIG